ncbi:MAG: efflux RND transporter periplasmic adaptor subunit [Pirellulales bacterium]|nr:efflux RND transporter periplasmic adaptor subunit [Pirellulales bacterium]
MIRRIALGVVAAALALGLLLASQWRSRPLVVSGFIETDEIRLGSRIGGRVARVDVEEGDRVKAGQTLVELEPYDLAEREAAAAAALAAKKAEYAKLTAGYRPQEIAQAEARYDRMKAEHDKLVAGPRPQEKDAARDRLQAAQAEMQFAEWSYDRAKDLFERSAIAKEELDRRSEQLRIARSLQGVRRNELALLEEGTRAEDLAAAAAAVKEAHAASELAKAGFRKEDVALAKAAMEAAAAELAAIGRQREELAIVAPLNGFVDSLDLRPGDLAAPSAPVMSMLNPKRLWVRAYLPENLSVPLGTKVRVTVDAFPDESFEAEVTFVSRQAEFTPNNVQTPEERSKQVFRIKVVLLEGLDRLRPGMAADVWLPPSEAAP